MRLAPMLDKRRFLLDHANDVWALSVVLGAAAWMAVTTRGTVTDDAFITYRYAYNFATGHGFVYNLGDHQLGTTAPFYGLMLGVLGIPHASAIPTLSVVIGVLSLMMSGAALYLYGRLNDTPFVGFVSALLFVLSPSVVRISGLEITFEIAVVLWAFVAYRLGRTYVAAVLLAIAILTRMDSAIALGIIGAHFVVTRRRLPLREGAVVCAVLLPFALAAFLYFGSPVPITLAAKQAQAEAGGWWQPFDKGLDAWMRSHAAASSYGRYVLLLFAIVGSSAILVRSRWWLMIVGWAGLHALGYTVLRPAFYDWYATTVMLGVAVLAALGADVVVAGLRQHLMLPRRPWVSNTVAVAVCLGVLIPLLRADTDYATDNQFSGKTAQLVTSSLPSDAFPLPFNVNAPAEEDVRFHLYRATGEWLRNNTPPGASVAYFEIGYIGYYAHRTIVDEMALLQPDVAPHIASRDFQWVFQHYKPDYIVLAPGSLCSCANQPWFIGTYHFVVQLHMSGTFWLKIYQRTASSS